MQKSCCYTLGNTVYPTLRVRNILPLAKEKMRNWGNDARIYVKSYRRKKWICKAQSRKDNDRKKCCAPYSSTTTELLLFSSFCDTLSTSVLVHEQCSRVRSLRCKLFRIEVLRGPSAPVVVDVIMAYCKIYEAGHVMLFQWILGHCDIVRNEQAIALQK